MKQHVKTALALTIIVATIVAFAYYITHHPQIVDQLRHVPPWLLFALLSLYGVAFLGYMFVTRGSLHLYGKHIPLQENILFNAYSSLVNFFGPGQSGPAFRGVYLKKRHNLRVKHFVFTTLVYYGFFGVLNIMLVCAGSRPWWQTLLLMALAGAGSVLVVLWYKKRSHIGKDARLTITNIAWIAAATVLQVIALLFIYALELRSIQSDLSWAQISAYTGIANLSVFVAITPGGIGIRESFLLFSTQLHHISNTTIVAASVIDRAAYLVFLGLLFVLVIGLHAKDKLHIKDNV
ncbi:MAG TPA: lysylphosphatidylglycerol synthase transmembrane domain-containing protein [Candidatus Saccharimonadales bacterium]|nr:lysylphosphatidylglycerol synthase transmembrane domain-containing protein [Candidatus Saccharimonadales bacterium]